MGAGVSAAEHNTQCSLQIQYLVKEDCFRRRQAWRGVSHDLFLTVYCMPVHSSPLTSRGCWHRLHGPYCAQLASCARTEATLPRNMQDVASATHILIGDKHEGLRELRLPKGRHVVTAQWLEQCLSQQERLPERDYAADLDELAQQAERESAAPCAMIVISGASSAPQLRQCVTLDQQWETDWC